MICDTVRAIRWKDDVLELLDQRALPHQSPWLVLDNAPDVAQAISDLVVRGAPAIGITAAYGVVLSWIQHGHRTAVVEDMAILSASRPTAINLNWALRRMQPLLELPGDQVKQALLDEADAIHTSDLNDNYIMGRLGAEYIQQNSGVLTHCNAGSLATGGLGTALGVIRTAWSQGRVKRVFAGETRPWLQGARLTAWELAQDEIPVSLIADGANAWLMSQGMVDWFIVGSDRVVANGDVANKIGTYSGAIAAKQHGVKVMVVAPTSTVDMSVAEGSQIPIEQRLSSEITALGAQQVAHQDAQAWNPVFDVTPAELVDVFVTEKGVIEHPNLAKMQSLMQS